MKSDGSTAKYYELPKGATELQQLISGKNMNAQIGEIFRSCYRYGEASHSDQLRDAKKIAYYAQAEIERLENSGIPKPKIKVKPSEELLKAFEEKCAKKLQDDDRESIILQNKEDGTTEYKGKEFNGLGEALRALFFDKLSINNKKRSEESQKSYKDALYWLPKNENIEKFNFDDDEIKLLDNLYRGRWGLKGVMSRRRKFRPHSWFEARVKYLNIHGTPITGDEYDDYFRISGRLYYLLSDIDNVENNDATFGSLLYNAFKEC